MKKVLDKMIKKANEVIDRGATCNVELSDFYNGQIKAYIDCIDDIADDLHITIDVNPFNGHLYIVK